MPKGKDAAAKAAERAAAVNQPQATLSIGGLDTPIVPERRQFSSGSHGFFGAGKITDPETGERLQVTVQAVIIGSKKWQDE